MYGFKIGALSKIGLLYHNYTFTFLKKPCLPGSSFSFLLPFNDLIGCRIKNARTDQLLYFTVPNEMNAENGC